MSDVATYWIVKATLGLLLLFSALTWTVVIVKGLQQWRLSRQSAAFATAVGTFTRLPSVDKVKQLSGPTARVALIGLDAWEDGSTHIGRGGDELDVRRDLLERELRRQIQREKRGAEAGLAILASVGTTSPFVGLFGTVVGIIHALGRISSMGSASLDVVAGPIGEALVATGFGIAVAVPAVLSYNIFVRRVKGLTADLEDFANALVNGAINSTFAHETPVDRSGNRPISVRREASA